MSVTIPCVLKVLRTDDRWPRFPIIEMLLDGEWVRYFLPVKAFFQVIYPDNDIVCSLNSVYSMSNFKLFEMSDHCFCSPFFKPLAYFDLVTNRSRLNLIEYDGSNPCIADAPSNACLKINS